MPTFTLSNFQGFAKHKPLQNRGLLDKHLRLLATMAVGGTVCQLYGVVVKEQIVKDRESQGQLEDG